MTEDEQQEDDGSIESEEIPESEQETEDREPETSEREPVTIESNERIGIFGKTGSGKTYAAKTLIWDRFDRVILHDWKDREAAGLQCPVLNDIGDVHEALFAEDERERITKFAYVPDATTDDYEEWEELCRLVFEKGNMHLIGDEVKGIYQSGDAVKPVTDHHEAILTRGRSEGVGITNLSQRPKRIPMEILSESEHLFAFRLNLKSDRNRIGEIVGRDHSERLKDLSDHRFMYNHITFDDPLFCDPL